MKKILPLLFCLFSLSAWSQRDSVGVFHRSDKVVIFVGELTARGQRLNVMMDTFTTEHQMKLESSDQSVSMVCSRISQAGSCTISLSPSEFVKIGQRKDVAVLVPLNQLNLVPSQSFDYVFQSANGDSMEISVADPGFKIFAKKAR